MNFYVPDPFVAGDSFDLAYASEAYPPSEWQATLAIRGPSAPLDVEGVDDNGMHAFELTSAATATLAPGYYTWALLMVRGDSRATVDRGAFRVDPNPLAIEAPSEQRSFARQALEKIDAALVAKSDTLSFTVFGRSYQYHTYAQLLEARREFARLVEAEDEQGRRDRGEPSRSVAVFRF